MNKSAEGRFIYNSPRAVLTVDCVLFGLAAGSLQLLLIRRGKPPFRGCLALPGGFVHVSDEGSQGEDLEAAARRELHEETGATVTYLEQLAAFGTPGRDPRGRVISVAYMGLVRASEHAVTGGDDAAEARWVPVHELLENPPTLAFDHAEIVRAGVERLQAKVRYPSVGFNLLPETFTLTELQSLYEAVLRRSLDKRNFRRRVLAMGIVAEAGVQGNVPHRAATLYRFDRQAYERSIRDGLDFEIRHRTYD